MVFLALLAFLLIMVALQRLFPDEGAPSGESGFGGVDAAVGEDAITEPAEPTQPAAVHSTGVLPGAQIAAMAVALYLSTEQEESGERSNEQGGCEVAVTTSASVPLPPTAVSNWTVRGRTALMESQSRRPPPYGQKLHSAYSQRDDSR